LTVYGTSLETGTRVACNVTVELNRDQEQLKPVHSTMVENVLAIPKKSDPATLTHVQVFQQKKRLAINILHAMDTFCVLTKIKINADIVHDGFAFHICYKGNIFKI